jgi:dTDP-4-dehydrorhamnose reductase
MRVLVVGGDGTIGSALRERALARGLEVVTTTRRALPVARDRVALDLRAVDALRLEGPAIDVAYLAAGVTSLEACRKAPGESRAINVDGVVALATRLQQAGIFTVFLSTNLVFDGTQPFRRTDEAVCPTTEYGRQKAEAEARLLALAGLAAVVRLTKVLTPSSALLRGWAAALQAGQAIRPFRDVVMAPIALDDVVEVLVEIGRRRLGGIHHLSGDADVSYADAARRFAAAFGAATRLVQPTTAAEARVLLEAVARHTTLDMAGLPERLGRRMRSTAECVDEVGTRLAARREVSHA